MKTLTRTIATSLAASLFASLIPVIAQQRREPRRPPAPKTDVARSAEEKKPVEPTYSTQPFDLSASSLPANFRGHNAIEIYKRLAGRAKVSTKSEFETTEAYHQRVAAEASKPLLGSLSQNSVLAFVIDKLKSKYDADQQIMDVKVKLSTGREGVTLDENKMSSLWVVINRDSSSYIGTNAYGAQVKVERKSVDFYEIAFANHQQFPIVRYLDDIAQNIADHRKKVYEKLGGKEPEGLDDFSTALTAKLKLDAQTAMKAKENLRLLFICRLLETYTIEGGTYSKPTIKSPREIFYKNYRLNTELLEVWFFDASTGQVYAKQKPL
ncbi:hypothetical protein BH18ACI3_BH18ACI3_18930 [soil metagenome]